MSDETLPLPLSLPQSGGWDAGLLEPLAELNEWMLACLRERAMSATPERPPPPLLEELRADWERLEPVTLGAIAACPYLLLELDWAGQDADAIEDRPEPHATSAYFQGPSGTALLRRALVFGWHVARANALAARLLLGLPPLAIERLAATRLQTLDLLAERGIDRAAPRWAGQPSIWRQLLGAGRAGPGPLRAAQLRGLQLLAARVG